MNLDNKVLETLKKQLQEIEELLIDAKEEDARTHGLDNYAEAKNSRRVKRLENLVEKLNEMIRKFSN